MSFEFGAVAQLNVEVTLIGFIATVVFLVSFDMVTGVLEYLVADSVSYSKIVQAIYKELMGNGIVAVILVIIKGAELTVTGASSTEAVDWFGAVDYSSIFLFFVTVFFVVHAFYFMRASYTSGKRYKFMFAEPVEDLITNIEEVNKNKFQKFLYEFDFLPLSSVRERVEFRLSYVLFRDAYCLPEDFHFAYYLSGCFERYAVKATSRSLISWVVLILFAILNFIRIIIDFSFNSCGGSGRNNLCRRNLVRLYFLCALLLCIYNLIIVGCCRYYKLRMLRKTGLKTTADYLDFLKFLAMEEEKRKAAITNEENYRRELRKRNRALKIDIQHVLDDDESAVQENEYKALALTLSRWYGDCKDFVSNLIVSIRVAIYTAWSGKEAQGGLLQRLEHVSGKVEEDDKDDPHNNQGDEEDQQREEDGSASTRKKSFFPSKSGPRKAVLHLHRSSLREKSFRSEGLRPSFFQQVAEQVQQGRAAMVKRFSVAKPAATANKPPQTEENPHKHPEEELSTNSIKSATSGFRNTAKVQPAPVTSPAPSPAPPAISLPATTTLSPLQIEGGGGSGSPSTLNSKSSSGKQLLPRQPRDTKVSPTMANFKEMNRQKNRQTMIASRSPQVDNKRKSGIIDQSVIDFLHNNLNTANLAQAGKGKSPSTTTPGGPRRGSAVLQKLTAAHHEELVEANVANPQQVEEIVNPLVEDELGLIQRYQIYRQQQRKRLQQSTTSVTLNDHNTVATVFHANDLSTSSSNSTFQARFSSFFSRMSFWTSGKLGHSSTTMKNENPNYQVLKDIESGEAIVAPLGDKRSETSEEVESFQMENLDDFTDIYLFGKPEWFTRAVELCTLFTCLYFAFWLNDFIAIAAKIDQPAYIAILIQIGMILPAFITFPCARSIAETCSMIGALSNLNLEVIRDVLVEAENTRELLVDLRKKMLTRIKALETTDTSMVDTVFDLFNEIDVKKNAWIDKFHFRMLLRALKLTFSDDRFNRLYRAVDSSGDGKLEWPELHELLFGHYDEKDPAPLNPQLESYSSNHRDSVSSERFSVVEANSNLALRQALLNSKNSTGRINRIAEGDENHDYDSSDNSEAEEDSDSESAFSRSNSRLSNHSGGGSNNRSRTNSYSKSPRNSLVKPSQLLKQVTPSHLLPASYSSNSSSSSPSPYHLASPSPVTTDRKQALPPLPSTYRLTEESEKTTEMEDIPFIGRETLLSIEEVEDDDHNHNNNNDRHDKDNSGDPTVTSPI